LTRREADRSAEARCQPGDHHHTKAAVSQVFRAGPFASDPVESRQLGGGHPDAGVGNADDDIAVVVCRTHLDGCPLGAERSRVFEQFGHQVRQRHHSIGPDHRVPIHGDPDPLVVFDLRRCRPHHIGDRQRIADGPLRVPPGQDHLRFGTAPHPRHQVVQREQREQFVGVGFRLLQFVENLQGTSHQRDLAARRSVDRLRNGFFEDPGRLARWWGFR
jgi:hypothetical protein